MAKAITGSGSPTARNNTTGVRVRATGKTTIRPPYPGAVVSAAGVVGPPLPIAHHTGQPSLESTTAFIAATGQVTARGVEDIGSTAELFALSAGLVGAGVVRSKLAIWDTGSTVDIKMSLPKLSGTGVHGMANIKPVNVLSAAATVVNGGTPSAHTGVASLVAAAGSLISSGRRGALGYGTLVSAPQAISNAAAFYASTDSIYDALYSAELAAQGGSNIYVSTTGNDTTGTGSSGAPYLTIGKAISVMAAGDQVIVKNGTYTGTSNWISTNQVAIPNGSAGAYTRIRAENRFGVRIVQSSSPAVYSDAPIKLGSKQYVWVDGFIVESTFTASTGDGNDDCVVDLSSAVHCRATRIIAKRKSCDQYGSSFQYGNGNVLEDCHHFGSSRYAYYGGTGGGSSAAGSTVLRRCVSFMPFGPVFEPTASFCFYGSNTSAYALCKDVLFANCYEIDSPHLPKKTGENAEDLKWGAWYHPKSVRNIEHVGCGVINGGAEYGAFRTDNYGGASDVLATFTDCFVSGLQNGNGTATPGGFSKASNGLITCTNYTVRDIPGVAVPVSGSTNTAGLTSSIVYPTQRVGGNGANQAYAVGAFLSEYGSSGYKTVQTSMPLWPFPYETYLHSIWGEAITRVTQDVPTGTSTSGDPATGTSLGGYPMTFTRRVWESAGNATPSFATGEGIY